VKTSSGGVLAASTALVGSVMLTATATALWGAADNDANSVKTPPGPVKKPTLPSGFTSKASKTLDGV
jgi:hypothetical protein